MWQGARRCAGPPLAAAGILQNIKTKRRKSSPMVKAEWGTKRSCPKCGTRFYDLGKDDPVTCIACGVAWEPEPVLKSKQPLPFDAPKKEVEVDQTADTDLAADDLAIDEDAEENPDDEVDIGGDDDLGVPGSGDEDEEI
jgi:uncharacterized protein (TIGR02300 family)